MSFASLRRVVPVAALLATATLVFAPSAHAQTSAYYILAGDQSQAYRVQNGVATLFTVPSLSYGISVRDTVLVANRNNQNATEYTLAGTPTGTTYANNTAFNQLLDGTTDGVQFNYGAVFNGGVSANQVIRTNLTWGGATTLFTLATAPASITYDTVSGNLWVGLFDNTIRQYTTSGIQVSSFSSGVSTASLAYEQATDTLWIAPNNGRTLQQYSKTGTLLQTVVVTGAGFTGFQNNFGGEMAIAAATPNAAAPEPGSIALLLVSGVPAIGLVRRRKHRV